ncbi:carboxylesterase family protein [Acetobacter musti]|uniref:Carboxylic ester hydrolase n=1 Tax=Acetobacter musti TaxID=864732 RepID=A0ABX0JPY0_9PROT|nr:carboxylesterase family protein [Acetobacter musti]NHN84837.1 carboxylesterase family protein [Acetobacter musti]
MHHPDTGFVRTLRPALTAALVATLTSGISGTALAHSPEVSAPAGVISGLSQENGDTFLGIPYAVPPVGPLRWQSAIPAPAASHPISAITQHEGCAALISGDAFETHNENCLYLNVYRPRMSAPHARLPVVVFIHGGANQAGTPAIYDGAAFAQTTHSIVVIPAYRLGIFGFLAISGEQKSRNPDGDLAAGDIVAALRWVHTNIGAFGGNPENVTLAGESAGAANVCDLLTAPASSGLFSQAIMESGFCPARPSLAVMQAAGAGAAKEAGCTGPYPFACLRSKPVKTLLESWNTVWTRPLLRLENGQEVPRPLFPMTPSGSSLQPVSPEVAIRSGAWHHVPVLVGFNRDELRSFLAGYYPLSPETYATILDRAYPEIKKDLTALYPLKNDASPVYTLAAIRTDQLFICPALRAASALSSSTTVSVYEFADRTAPPFHSLAMKLPAPEGFDRGASHTAELPYLFGYKSVIGPLSAEQTELSRKMMAMWQAFGQPDSGWSRWTQENPVVTVIADNRSGGIQNRNDIAGLHHCDFWANHPQLPNTLFP